jgi:predicted thioesterase
MPDIGIRLERRYLVQEEHLASRFGSGLADVLSTPALVGFCEETARLSVETSLEPGHQTVGGWVSLQHLAPTPPGWWVTVRSELVEVDGRRLRFTVEAYDEAERIAQGEHLRVIVDGARFAQRVHEKRRRSDEGPADRPAPTP